MRKSVLLVGLAFFFSLICLSRSAFGAAVPMTTGELASAAERVLFATVEQISQPDPGRYLIEVRLRPIETLKGTVEGEVFVLRLVGGVVNGIGLLSSEDPRLKVGEPVIIFLQSQTYPYAPVVGGKQGCLHLEKGRVMEKGTRIDDFLASVRAKVSQPTQKRGTEKKGDTE